MAGCLLMMGLASCEMKDEILGNKKDPGEMGVMNLSVVVDARSNDVLTKAGDGTQEGGDVSVPAVSATGYAVEISNGEGLYKTVTYDATNPSVELPVGDYTLYAHAQDEPKETEAYYGGRASLKVEKGKQTDASVVCKMENTKIQLVYTTEMQSSFKNWEITVTAGSKSKILSYSGTNFVQQPDAFFWTLDEGVKEVRVSFVGTNKDDKAVRESRVITKPATAEDPDWLGGDALRIDVKPGAYDPANPNGVLGIEISAEVRWSGVEDSVDVPVVDDGGNTDPEVPEEPEVPGDDSDVKITLPQQRYTLPADLSKNNDVVIFNASRGLASLKVIIKPGNDSFKNALSFVENALNANFSNGVELIGNKDFESQMGLVVSGITVPEKVGVTTYSFPIGKFFDVLNDPDFGNTSVDEGHYFKIVATAVGSSQAVSEELNIIVD